MAHRHRADMVYSGRPRWYLIIFASHTLVLDRRTCSSGTPLPQLIPQRSEDFTSGVSISITTNRPISAVQSQQHEGARTRYNHKHHFQVVSRADMSGPQTHSCETDLIVPSAKRCHQSTRSPP